MLSIELELNSIARFIAETERELEKQDQRLKEQQQNQSKNLFQ